MKLKRQIGIGLAVAAATYCVLAYIFMWPPVVIYGDRTPAYACMNNLRQLDAAIAQYALEHGKHNGDPIHLSDLTPYIKLTPTGEIPPCPAGGPYTVTVVGAPPTCRLETNPSVKVRIQNFYWCYPVEAGIHHKIISIWNDIPLNVNLKQ